MNNRGEAAPAKSIDTWMPFYVADYLKDTRHLSTVEHGAYVLLIMQAWSRDGLLPLDQSRLARIAGVRIEDWPAIAEVVLEFFTKTEHGYRHARIDRELERAKALLEQRVAAGKASAVKRASQRNGNGRSTVVATTVATERPTEGQRNSRPSPSPSPSSLRSDDDDVETRAIDLVDLTDDLARIAGVRHLEPGRIEQNIATVREWIDRGAAPDALRSLISQTIAAATTPIHSLKYFDGAVRLMIAKENSHGSTDAHIAAGAGFDNELARAVLADEARRRGEFVN